MSDRLAPRPGEERGGVTKLGALREKYSATIEGRPPMFIRITDPRWLGTQYNKAYREWAQRADAWADKQNEETS